MRANAIAMLVGAYGLAMVLGALFFQYVVGVAPCEVCFWQRIPHLGAAVVGFCGAALFAKNVVNERCMMGIAALTLVLAAVAGGLGVYHSGVEWRIWAGPEACTGDRFVFTGTLDLDTPPVVRCDVVSWRFFGIFSLANLNAIFSLGIAALGALFLVRRDLAKKILAALRR